MLMKKLLYDFVGGNKYLIILYFIVILLTFPVESIILPYFYSKLFQSVKNNNKKITGIFTNIKHNIKSFNSLGIIWIIILIKLINILFYGFKSKLDGIIIPEYLSYVRKIIFSNTILKHSENYEDIKVGEHISRIMDLSRNMKDSLQWALNILIPSSLGIIFILIYFFILNVKIGLILLIGIIITFIIFIIYGSKCIDISSKREGYYLTMNEKLHDSFGNLMNIYINNKSEDEIKNNRDIEQIHTDLYKKQSDVSTILSCASQFISFITFAAVLLISYILYLNSKISSGSIITIIIILIYYVEYLITLSEELPTFFLKIGIIKQSKLFLKELIKINKSQYINDEIMYNNINFNNVSFRYPKTNRYILKNFNFKIKSNIKTAIIGQSGLGKTTIMKLLINMYYPESGTITIDGKDIKNIPVNKLRSNIIYVNQKTGLFNDTVINNIKYGNNTSYDEIISYIKKYKFDTIYAGLTNGVDNVVGVNGGNLSLGMQKITLLLRGIFKKSKVIIFDEPLAGLDKNTRIKVMKLINDISSNKTIIVITHDVEILPHMDAVIDLNKLVLK